MMSDLTPLQIDNYMQEALFEAQSAFAIGEVPIGAVVVCHGQIIGRGHNLREHGQDATLHAEMLAITEACEYMHSWRLPDAKLFVTLEPCPMCAGAIINSRIAEVYYGAPDPKAGTAGTLMNLLTDQRFNHQAKVVSGIRQTEAAQLLHDFFKEIRKQRKQRKHQK